MGRIFVLSLTAGMLLLAGSLPALVLAKGTTQAQEPERAGPYLVSVSPSQFRTSIGQQLVAVTLLDATTGGPVTGASVTIRTVNETTGAPGWANALSTPSEPRQFTAILRLNSPGRWRLSLDISSPLGEAMVDLPSTDVVGPSSSLAGYLVYALVLSAILLGGVYIWRKTKRVAKGMADP